MIEVSVARHGSAGLNEGNMFCLFRASFLIPIDLFRVIRGEERFVHEIHEKGARQGLKN